MSFLDRFFNKGPKPKIAPSQSRDLSILKVLVLLFKMMNFM